MKRLTFLSCLMIVGLACSAAAASDLDVPPPLDVNHALLERYWSWLKTETGAPEKLSAPPIDIAPLPRTVRMAFLFPAAASPWGRPRIVIAPATIDRAASGERLVVIGELAHEMVHYALLLQENDWDLDREIYGNKLHHHCDPEFQRLSRKIADFLWQAYHSSDTTRAIDQMVRLACWRDGHVLSERPDIRMQTN